MTDCQEQLALARRQLEAVQRISEALYSTTDTEALQRLALQTAMDVVGADAGSMLLYDADHNALVFRIALGPVADTLTGTSLDLNIGSGIARQVFLSGTSLITQNAPEDADHIGTVDQRTGYQTQSLMTVPLRRTDGGSQPYGIVQLLNKKNGRFDDSDVAVTEIMGSLVAMAVRNAVLGQRARLAAVAYSVGEISHDIGNMLTYILPYVQTLELYIAEVRTGKPGALEELDAFYLEVVSSVADGVEQVELRAKEIARQRRSRASGI
jgi:GAF domain-containing protein